MVKKAEFDLHNMTVYDPISVHDMIYERWHRTTKDQNNFLFMQFQVQKNKLAQCERHMFLNFTAQQQGFPMDYSQQVNTETLYKPKEIHNSESLGSSAK